MPLPVHVIHVLRLLTNGITDMSKRLMPMFSPGSAMSCHVLLVISSNMIYDLQVLFYTFFHGITIFICSETLYTKYPNNPPPTFVDKMIKSDKRSASDKK